MPLQASTTRPDKCQHNIGYSVSRDHKCGGEKHETGQVISFSFANYNHCSRLLPEYRCV